MTPTLNPKQKAAAEAPIDRPLLIIAGAGTGKTRTLTSRLAYLVSQGVPPEAICAITFTNKAAREMEKRVFGDMPPKSGGPFIGTFHSLGASFLRKEARKLGRTPAFVIFDDSDSFSLLKKVLKPFGKTKDTPSAIHQKISSVKSGVETLDGASPLFTEIFESYERGLQRSNAFDFDDLLQKPVALMKNNPEVRERYAKKFRHILIDEYQDVNNMQYELVRLLTGGGAMVSAVGDAEQTIYSWRGSNIEIFLSCKPGKSGSGKYR